LYLFFQQMARAARAMRTVRKRAMATDGEGNGNSGKSNGGSIKEGGRHSTVVAMMMGMGMGTVQRTQLLALQLERGG
jgi:hypothetical protein